MYTLFLASLIGFIITIPLNFISLEHEKLERIFGKEKGEKIGVIIAIIAGWGLFIFWIGIWISPQPRFILSPFNIIIPISFLGIKSSLSQIIIFILFFSSGMYLGLAGVKTLGLKVAETHKPEKIITEGLYSKIRHPQYLGGILAHIGITFLLSAFYSLLATPLIIFLIYLLAWKEEKELIREFGDEYIKYRERVPMFIPRIRNM